jgi:hypothetical protein
MTPTIFSVQLEVEVKSPLHQYTNIQNPSKVSTSFINESAKHTVAEDIEDALRKYGIDATVGLVRKIQQ